MRALASALARSLCSCINRRNSSVSTVSPASAAISSVRSIGKPWVSCSTNAVDPGTTLLPDSLVSCAATSNSLEPDAMVRRNACSSFTATRWIRSKSVASSG